MDIISAFILGVVEGITEFLPISSTGHLILTSKVLSIEQTNFTKSFEIIIQMGAISSVIFMYFRRLFTDFRLWKVIIIAFIPSGITGFLLSKFIKEYFFNYLTVSLMLIIWGIVFIVVEKVLEKRNFHKLDVDYKMALLIGIFQCFSLIPGTSRSGATIIGGMLVGLDRRSATEFSFLLSVPTMLIATSYEFYKGRTIILSSDMNFIIVLIGFVTSFVFAYISVKWLLSFVSNHSLVIFGIYRIVVGLIFLILFR